MASDDEPDSSSGQGFKECDLPVGDRSVTVGHKVMSRRAHKPVGDFQFSDFHWSEEDRVDFHVVLLRIKLN